MKGKISFLMLTTVFVWWITGAPSASAGTTSLVGEKRPRFEDQDRPEDFNTVMEQTRERQSQAEEATAAYQKETTVLLKEIRALLKQIEQNTQAAAEEKQEQKK